MKLTLHADYGLRTLLFLALEPQRVVSIGEIAGAYGISNHHLAKVAQALGRTGFVEIHRGTSGGLRLVRDPKEIRIGDVVRALEPNLSLVECFDPETNTCPILPVCGLRGVLGDARDAFMAVLDRATLADALGKPRSLSKLVSLREPASPPAKRAQRP